MLRLVSDENFNGDIVRGLLFRLPDLNLVRVQDVGLEQAIDPVVLAWAAQDDRIIVTHDRATLPHFAYERVVAGEPMPGVFVINDRLPVGQLSKKSSWSLHVARLLNGRVKFYTCRCKSYSSPADLNESVQIGRSRISTLTQDGSQVDHQLFDIVEGIKARGAAEMRRDDDVAKLDEGVVGIARLVVESVEPKAAQSAGGESLAQGVALDLVRLRDINQQSPRFDDCKLASTNEIAGLWAARQM